jgi:hypothetical protein
MADQVDPQISTTVAYRRTTCMLGFLKGETMQGI